MRAVRTFNVIRRHMYAHRGVHLSVCFAAIWTAQLAEPHRSHADPAPVFVDVTSASGLQFTHHVPLPPASPVGPSTWAGAGAAVADVDGDGDLDVYFVDSFGWPNRLFINGGNGTFAPAASGLPLANTGSGRMALFVDLDNDGDPDLLLGNDTQGYPGMSPSAVFRNDGGTFVDVTAGSGFNPQGIILGGMAASDYDGDGLLDIYVTQWDVLPGTPFNYLYHNIGGFRFEDRTDAMGLRPANTQVQTWSPVFFDVDGDGDQDLFVAVDFDLNYLFRLDQDAPVSPLFTDISVAAHVFHCCNDASGNDMGVAVGDVDGDDDLDIFTTNLTLPPPNEQLRANAMLINHGLPEPFTDEAVGRGVWQSYWGWGAAFFDAELDGDLDLYTVNGRSAGDGGHWSDRPAQLFINDGGADGVGDGSGYFSEVAEAAGVAHRGNSRGFIPFDYDLDGDLDLLVTNVAQPAVLFRNDTPKVHHWLGVTLRGVHGPRDAIGTKIRIRAGGRTQLRETMAGGSFYASLPLEAHFGVGTATVVDELRIDWPGGDSTRWINIPVDQRLIVEEGQARPFPVVTGLTIVAPAEAVAGSTVQLDCIASNYYAADRSVADEVAWSIAPAVAGTVSATGSLVLARTSADRTVIVNAALAGQSASASILVRGTAQASAGPTVSIMPVTENPTAEAAISVFAEVATEVALSSVTWSNPPVHSGPCATTPEAGKYECGSIPLEPGANSITVTATDAMGLIGHAVVQVIRVEAAENTLSVFPPTLSFGDGVEALELSIWSTHGGIAYAIVPSDTWLRVVPAGGVTGTLAEPTVHQIELLERPETSSAATLEVRFGSDVDGGLAIPVSAAARGTPIGNANDNTDPVGPDGDANANDNTASPEDPPANQDGGENDNATSPNADGGGEPPAVRTPICGAVGLVPSAFLMLALALMRRRT